MSKEFDKKQLVPFFQDKKIIGIDPGRSAGAIVVYSSTRERIVAKIGLDDKTPKDLIEIFKFLSINSVAVLEKVHGMPENGGSRAFTFGQGFGWIESALVFCKIPTEQVAPQTWQKVIKCGVRGNKTKSQWKTHLKGIAESLYPHMDMTLQYSDAVLITHYGRLKYET